MLNRKDLVKLAGLIAGDGYIDSKGRIGFQHSILQQEYVDYKVKYAIDNFEMKFKTWIKDKLTGFSTNPNYLALSTVKQYIKKLKIEWYKDKQKFLPKELILDFEWEQWAFLYQDDGRENKSNFTYNLKDGKRIKTKVPTFVNRYEIFLGNITNEYAFIFQESLTKLGVYSHLRYRISKSGKAQYILSIRLKEAKDLFYNKISPLLHDSMKYKMNALPSLTYNCGERLSEETKKDINTINFGSDQDIAPGLDEIYS